MKKNCLPALFVHNSGNARKIAACLIFHDITFVYGSLSDFSRVVKEKRLTSDGVARWPLAPNAVIFIAAVADANLVLQLRACFLLSYKQMHH